MRERRGDLRRVHVHDLRRLGWLDDTCTYVTYRWQFTNDTFAEAAADALAWVTALAPWKQCIECDGQGRWNDESCDECNGTGLANG